ncbi:hypothetical protein M1583_01415, partial [Candidatus Marsarchaeota archaeon]|nr:hypothetical protein [Candidatus Marsarchaeota archaeon]
NNTNSTYQGQAKNYTKTTQTYYNKLLANAQGSVKDIFLSLEIISGLLIAYIMEIFEVFELIFKSRRNLTTSGILFILAICVFGYIFGFYNIVEHIIEFFAVILFIALILFFINRKNKNQIINNPIKPNPPLPPPSNPI